MATRSARGRLEKTIIVYSNDPKQPQFQLKMTGQVEMVAGFEQPFLVLGNVLKGAEKKASVKLVGKELDKLEVSEITSNRKEFSAQLAEENGARVLQVTFKAPDQEGRIAGSISAKTNLENPKELRLTVTAQVTGDLVTTPQSVLFGPFDEKKPPTAVVRVQSLGGKPFKVLKVEDTGAAVVGTPQAKDGGWQVELSLTKSPKAPRGTVRLMTDRKDQPVVEVQYNVRTIGGPMPAGMIRGPGPGGGPHMLKPIEGRGPPPGKQPMRLAPEGKRLPLRRLDRPVKPGPAAPPPPAPTK